MINFNIQNFSCDKNFRLRALSEYYQEISNNYKQLIDFSTDVITGIPEFEDDETATYHNTELIRYVDDKLAEYGYSGTEPVTFDQGYTTLRSWLINIVKQSYNNTLDTYIEDLNQFKVHLTSRSSTRANITITPSDSLTQLKSGLYSIIATSAAVEAMNMSNIADRLSIFNDRMSNVFANVYDTTQSTAIYLRNLISNPSSSVDVFINSLADSINFESLANDDDTSDVADTDIYKYTGASPVPAINWSSVGKGASTVWNAGCKVMKGIWQGVKSIGKSIFAAAKDKIINPLIDPQDLEIINKDGAPICNGWEAFARKECKFAIDNPVEGFPILSTEHFNYLSDKYLNHVISIRDIFSEHWMKFISFNISDGVGTVQYELHYKPKILNSKLVFSKLKEYLIPDATTSDPSITVDFASSNITIANITAFLNSLQSLENLYLDTSYPDSECLIGILMSYSMSYLIGAMGDAVIINNITSDTVPIMPTSQFVTVNNPYHFLSLNPSATNQDFVRAFCSINELVSMSSADFHSISSIFVARKNAAGGDMWNTWLFDNNTNGTMALPFLYQRVEALKNPIDFPFIPYLNNLEPWSVPKFSVRTDEQNNATASSILTVAAVAIVVATAAISFSIAATKIKRGLFIKRTSLVNKLNRDMSMGIPLTTSEKKKYNRATKKLNLASQVASGMQSGGALNTVLESVNSTSQDSNQIGINSIISLIK